MISNNGYMKTKILRNNLLVSISILIISSFIQTKVMAATIREETVSYTANGVTMKGFVAFDEKLKGKLPVVLIVHEWWGLNDYVKMRAREFAEMGYLAMAVDMFGDGKTASDPKQAQALAMPFYQDPGLAKTRMDAAIAVIEKYTQADPGKRVAVGYCFGGYVVLNCAKLGADLNAVVSFHGGLGGAPADKSLLKAKILVCQGESDKFVTMQDLQTFSHQMDSIGAYYTVRTYANATHAFTNPDATRVGKEFNLPIEYNAAADKASWNDMKIFLKRIFGE
jgi:dienelactone hydrolase